MIEVKPVQTPKEIKEFIEFPLKLYKGNIIRAGIWSDYSLYSEDIATFGASDYDQKDSAGFITLFGLPTKVQALVDAANSK